MLFYLYSITLLMCYIITLFILLFFNIVLQYIPNKCLVEKEEILLFEYYDKVHSLSYRYIKDIMKHLVDKNITRYCQIKKLLKIITKQEVLERQL